MFTALMGVGIGLIGIGMVCLLVANREDRTPGEQRRLRLAAAAVDVVAAGAFMIAAFL